MSPSAGRDLGRYLRLDTEAVLFEHEALHDFAPECLVAGLHVGEVQVGEHVRQHGEGAVADGVPEVEHSMRAARHEARSVNDVGLTVEKRSEDVGVLGWVVLEVGVLHDHVRVDRLGEPTAQGGALALIDWLEEHPHAWVVDGGEYVARAVGGTVVDDQQLGNVRGIEDRLDDLTNGRPLVVAGHHNTQAAVHERQITGATGR